MREAMFTISNVTANYDQGRGHNYVRVEILWENENGSFGGVEAIMSFEEFGRVVAGYARQPCLVNRE